jgi:hypothetical protein
MSGNQTESACVAANVALYDEIGLLAGISP